MPILELETPEAQFIKDMSRDCHFGIDCVCGGKDGKYSGSHYKNASEGLVDITRNYVPLRSEIKFQHTFYLSETILLHKLFKEHRQEDGQQPLIIVCDDCGREFSFTHESYLDLDTRLKMEYNRRLMEEDKARPSN